MTGDGPVKIPVGKSGHPTVSATQLRTYGAGGFHLDEQEQPRGCPRKYQSRYVHGVADEPTDRMLYGRLVHRVFELVERDGADPYEALLREFPPELDPDLMTEARRDLDDYLARQSSPLDDMHTLGVELDLEAPLYVDEDHGPVWYRAILDKVLIDPDRPDRIHVVDYKTSRTPPSRADLRGDVQLKGQAWVLAERWPHMAPSAAGVPQVWVHLDAVKWRDLAHSYTAADLDDWRMWAVAVTRAILRDDTAAPRVNPGCPQCVVRHDCPALDKLPARGAALVKALAAGELEERIQWRDLANGTRILLEKAVKAIDAEIAELVRDSGPLVAAGYRWSEEQQRTEEVDVRRLAELLGDDIWAVVNVVKGRLEQLTESWPASDQDQVWACFTERVTGLHVKRTKYPR